MRWHEVGAMVTVLILAGGKSTRMGQDKALMNGGVSRLLAVARDVGIQRIVTLCGTKERSSLFEGEVWPDPASCDSLMDVLAWAIAKVDDEIQLIPCDAFELEFSGLNALISSSGGVPIDSNAMRQPLLARCPADWKPRQDARNIQSMFADLASLDMGVYTKQMSNFNSPDVMSVE